MKFIKKIPVEIKVGIGIMFFGLFIIPFIFITMFDLIGDYTEWIWSFSLFK